jgi:excisionase family DNA binding protein
MATMNLIAWRHREKKFPDTEAQQRARARELSEGCEQPALQTAPPVELSAVLPLDLPPLTEGDLTAMRVSEESLTTAKPAGNGHELSPVVPDTLVSVQLTPEQSQVFSPLARLADGRGQVPFPLIFELAESREQERVVLQFSLHTTAPPQMISLPDLCRRLGVGRRLVMKLIHDQQLRSYRIGRRYRFALADVREYLDRSQLSRSAGRSGI